MGPVLEGLEEKERNIQRALTKQLDMILCHALHGVPIHCEKAVRLVRMVLLGCDVRPVESNCPNLCIAKKDKGQLEDGDPIASPNP